MRVQQQCQTQTNSSTTLLLPSKKRLILLANNVPVPNAHCPVLLPMNIVSMNNSNSGKAAPRFSEKTRRETPLKTSRRKLAESPQNSTNIFSNEKIKYLIKTPDPSIAKICNPNVTTVKTEKATPKMPLTLPCTRFIPQMIGSAKERLKAVTELLSRKEDKGIPKITPLPFLGNRPITQSKEYKKPKPMCRWGQVDLKWNVGSQKIPMSVWNTKQPPFAKHFLNIKRLGSVMDPEASDDYEGKCDRHKSMYSLETSPSNGKSARRLYRRANSIKRRHRHYREKLNETNIRDDGKMSRYIIKEYSGTGKEIAVETNNTDLKSKNQYFNLSVHFTKARIHKPKAKGTQRGKVSFGL